MHKYEVRLANGMVIEVKAETYRVCEGMLLLCKLSEEDVATFAAGQWLCIVTVDTGN